jgi:hypothetical protein
MQIVSGKQSGAERVVIAGVEGIGKSTLASQFPKPLFLDVEGSTSHMDVCRLPRPSSWAGVMATVSELTRDHHDYETLVIDTVDWAERICAEALIAEHNVKGIEAFGYGKGYKYLAESFGKFLDALSGLVDSGMHVVLVAHVATRKFELPEETGAYDRWELKLSKNVAPLVKEWAYMVLFCNYKTFVVVDEKTKSNKAMGNERVMYTAHSATWDAKNRHGLKPELPFAWDSIKHMFPSGVKAVPVVAEAPAPVAVPDTKPFSAITPLDKLRHLMVQTDVSDEDLVAAIVHKGYFPAGTPVENIPADFIEGRLLPNWGAVRNVITKIKGEAA